jgi:arylsulfatase A-like enzyme
MGKCVLSRRRFLKTATVAAGLGTSTAREAEQATPTVDCGSVWEAPPKQQGNNLNLIVIVSDTFRADNLKCYGSQWIDCPNLNRFAEESIIFEDAYSEGLPTVCVRRTLYTGRRIFPFYYFPQHDSVQEPGWHPLYYEDVTLSESLKAAGYITALITDIPHLQRPDRNFHRGFDVYQWIRGQMGDHYQTSPHQLLDVTDMTSAHYLEKYPGSHWLLSDYKANRNVWIKDGESLVQIVADMATRWINSYHTQRPFYLHVDAWDPHEPWDPPRRFLEKYMANPQGPSYIDGPYIMELRERLRANYAGEATCVDFWLGRLLQTIAGFGLLDNSIVVFCSDHGTLLGEQSQFNKGPDKLRGQVTHVPLLMRMPGKQYAGSRVSGFVQVMDIMPTLLHLLGLKSPSRVTGRNAWPLVTGETKSLHEHVIQGFSWVAAVRTREWNYNQVWKANAPQVPYAPQLYNLEKDPKELMNVAARYPDVVRQLSALLKEYISSGKGITQGSFNGKESLKKERMERWVLNRTEAKAVV